MSDKKYLRLPFTGHTLFTGDPFKRHTDESRYPSSGNGFRHQSTRRTRKIDYALVPKFKTREYHIAVKVVNNEGLENLEVITLKSNGKINHVN